MKKKQEMNGNDTKLNSAAERADADQRRMAVFAAMRLRNRRRGRHRKAPSRQHLFTWTSARPE